MKRTAANHQRKVRRRHRTAASPVTDAFAPLGVSGLVAWYDFADASTLFTDAGTTPVSADGDAIYQANDKSGNARHVVQATAANRPLYKTNILKGRSVARFDGGDILSYTGGLAVAQPGTIFIVGSAGDVGAQNFTDGSLDPQRWALGKNGGVARLYAGLANIDAGAVDTNPHIFAALVNGASSELYVAGGTVYATGNPGTQSLVGLSLGAFDTVTQQLIGDVAEVAIYNSALSDANINNIGRWFAYKWGLTWTAVV